MPFQPRLETLEPRLALAGNVVSNNTPGNVNTRAATGITQR
jgi:hypothetical protein